VISAVPRGASAPNPAQSEVPNGAVGRDALHSRNAVEPVGTLEVRGARGERARIGHRRTADVHRSADRVRRAVGVHVALTRDGALLGCGGALVLDEQLRRRERQPVAPDGADVDEDGVDGQALLLLDQREVLEAVGLGEDGHTDVRVDADDGLEDAGRALHALGVRLADAVVVERAAGSGRAGVGGAVAGVDPARRRLGLGCAGDAGPSVAGRKTREVRAVRVSGAGAAGVRCGIAARRARRGAVRVREAVDAAVLGLEAEAVGAVGGGQTLDAGVRRGVTHPTLPFALRGGEALDAGVRGRVANAAVAAVRGLDARDAHLFGELAEAARAIAAVYATNARLGDWVADGGVALALSAALPAHVGGPRVDAAVDDDDHLAGAAAGWDGGAGRADAHGAARGDDAAGGAEGVGAAARNEQQQRERCDA